MCRLKALFQFLMLCLVPLGLWGQIMGGPCEGCEAAMEFEGGLAHIDTSYGWFNDIDKLILLGQVVDQRGVPVKGVIVYYYHTDPEGRYSGGGELEGWGRRHGLRRGWVSTNAQGRYVIYTSLPGKYPENTEPAHIHLTVKEKGKPPYYIDEVVFKGGDKVSNSYVQSQAQRGGTGLCEMRCNSEGHFVVERKIILGQNIPNYR